MKETVYVKGLRKTLTHFVPCRDPDATLAIMGCHIFQLEKSVSTVTLICLHFVTKRFVHLLLLMRTLGLTLIDYAKSNVLVVTTQPLLCVEANCPSRRVGRVQLHPLYTGHRPHVPAPASRCAKLDRGMPFGTPCPEPFVGYAPN